MRHELTLDELEAVVAEALESLPKRFAGLLRNVAVAIEEEPTVEDLTEVDDDEDELEGDEGELLGIYRGVPLTERGHDDPLLPDEIVIFRGPINRVARDRDDAVKEVRETVVHELGHYFGLHEHELP